MEKIIFPAFILVALAQLYVPAKMILDRERVLDSGVEYKFKAAPIDPSDPFRGKYITLQYDNNTVEVYDEEDWASGETVYVLFMKDSEGFAQIESVSKDKPIDGKDFIKTTVSHIIYGDILKLEVDYPFDRYYMDEFKAYEAEMTYRRSLLDTGRVTYALVSIQEGTAVLSDVMIDGVPIRDIVEAQLESEEAHNK